MGGAITRPGRELDSRAKALIAARAALEKHAEGVVVLNLQSLSTVTDFFLICTAASSRQISAIQEHIEATLAQQGCSVWHTEGAASARAGSRFTPAPTSLVWGFTEEPQWVLMDCGDFVVHLLDQRARAFYRLEELWADAPRLPLEDRP